MVSRDLGFMDIEVADSSLKAVNDIGGMLTNLRPQVCETPNPQPPTPNHDHA